MAGKHRDPNQPGDRIKVLKAGQAAMANLARKAGATEAQIKAAVTKTQ